jgi:putative multiple sugar transport system permease protein
MIGAGTLIGTWQGFWIAYVRIPPFIVTLAGMLIFRGLSNVILDGLTLSSLPESYLNLFNTFLPDIFGGPKEFNITCMVAGILACIIFVISQSISRKTKIKKGYDVVSLFSMVIKMVIICIAVLAFMFRLSQYSGIPTALFWIVAVILIYAYITSKTTIGRHFYAVGGNEKATRLSGINTNKVYFLAYLNMGFLSAIAGMITMARLYSANPTAGFNYELDAIGACFIGGASAYGGIGTVPGVIIGAILMGVINLGMNIMGVDANYQKVVKGTVLLAAVIFDVVSKKSGKRN